MTKTRKAVVALVAAAVAGAGGVAYAGGVGGDDDADETDRPITGSALERAERAALDHLGDGRVTETEIGDEEGYYEVEVTRSDGGQVDVHLTPDFDVLSTEGDDDRIED